MDRNKTTRRRVLGATFAAAALLGFGAGAHAAYPDKPVHFIVPFAAGSSSDLTARQIAPPLAKALGQQVVVDNRGGASAIVGTQQAAKAPADGYTIFLGNSTALGLNPSLFKTLPYDPVKDFTSLGLTTFYPLTLVVSKKLGVHNVKDLVAYAKTHPNLKYASSGVGSVPNLTGAQFNKAAGIDLGHVPYNDVPQAFTDMIGGLTAIMFYPYVSLKAQIDSGAIEAIATTGPNCAPWEPDIPTMTEQGYPDVTVQAWTGLYAPSGTPAEELAVLTKASQAVLKDPEFQKAALASGMVLSDMPAPDTNKFTAAEIQRYHQLADLAGIKPE